MTKRMHGLLALGDRRCHRDARDDFAGRSRRARTATPAKNRRSDVFRRRPVAAPRGLSQLALRDHGYRHELRPRREGGRLTGNVMFDNVFVQPQAYDAFLRDGVWPEGTMFVLELRGTETQRPPNNRGYFQTDLHGIEVSVKDSTRFKGRWAYFDFGMEAKSATPQPQSECFSCHEKNTAVDMTFVQFYPTLQKVTSCGAETLRRGGEPGTGPTQGPNTNHRITEEARPGTRSSAAS